MDSDTRGAAAAASASARKPRARECGIVLGTMAPGPYNAITDVDGVRVGHVTIIDGGSADPPRGPARTGVTAVLPHGGNLFREKVPAAFHVINGHGKAIGSTQVQELGVIETPIALTNTLSVGAVFEGLVRHALDGNPDIGRSTGTVNPVVAECSDARLNDIRALMVRPEHVGEAIRGARGGSVTEGSVGAGTGMICYGWKGGIGTASRLVSLDARVAGPEVRVAGPEVRGPGTEVRAACPDGEPYVVGVLVLANFGRARDLRIGGIPVGETLRPPAEPGRGPAEPGRGPAEPAPAQDGGGSCVVVLATSAPADARQLGRLARRVQNGLARTGTFGEHGSGEYVIAFSTARRIPHAPGGAQLTAAALPEDGPLIDELFRAVAESTEEAVVNALLAAEQIGPRSGHLGVPLPVSRLAARLATGRSRVQLPATSGP